MIGGGHVECDPWSSCCCGERMLSTLPRRAWMASRFHLIFDIQPNFLGAELCGTQLTGEEDPG